MLSGVRKWAVAGAAMLVVALTAVLGFVALNYAVWLVYDGPPAPADWHAYRKQKSGEQRQASTGGRRRSSCRRAAPPAAGCRPYISASQYPPAGSLLPITGGMPNSTLVGCNELGRYRFARFSGARGRGL